MVKMLTVGLVFGLFLIGVYLENVSSKDIKEPSDGYDEYIYHNISDGRIVPMDYNCEIRPGIIYNSNIPLEQAHKQVRKEITELCD